MRLVDTNGLCLDCVSSPLQTDMHTKFLFFCCFFFPCSLTQLHLLASYLVQRLPVHCIHATQTRVFASSLCSAFLYPSPRDEAQHPPRELDTGKPEELALMNDSLSAALGALLDEGRCPADVPLSCQRI